MRETRQSGSEGGAARLTRRSYPYRVKMLSATWDG